MKSKILLSLTLILILSVFLTGSVFAQTFVANDTAYTSGTAYWYNTAGATADSHVIKGVITLANLVATDEVDTLLFFFPAVFNAADTTNIDTATGNFSISIEGTDIGTGVISVAGWVITDSIDITKRAWNTGYSVFDDGKYGRDYHVYRIALGTPQDIAGTTLEFKLRLKNFSVDTANLNIDNRGKTGLGSPDRTTYMDSIAVVAIDSATEAGGPNRDIGFVWLNTVPGAASSMTTTVSASASADTVGLAFTNNDLEIKVVDANGIMVLDSTTVVKVKAANSGGNVYGGAKFFSPYYDHSSSAQYDTMKAPWSPSTSGDYNWKIDLENYSYNKAYNIYFLGYYGSSLSDLSSNTHNMYATHPYELSSNSYTNSSSVTVNQNTDVFTITVIDTFGNVCRDDSVYFSSHYGTGVIDWDDNSDFSSPANVPATYSGGAPLDNAGKAWVRMTAGTFAGSDSLIAQVWDVTSAPDDTYLMSSSGTRKAIYIEIEAGALHSISLYPEDSDLSDQNAGDYYNKSNGFGEQGKVMAGDSILFRILLKDQYGNHKAATSSDISNITLTAKRNPSAFSSMFIRSESDFNSSESSTFDVDVIGFAYKTSSSATGSIWNKNATYAKDTVTASYSGLSTSDPSTEFETKGGFPAAARFILSNGNVVNSQGTATDTVRVDSVYTVKAILFDANGNIADTLRKVTFYAGANTQITSGITDNAKMRQTSTYNYTAPPNPTSFSDIATTDTDSTTIDNSISSTTDSVVAWSYFKSDSAKGYVWVGVKDKDGNAIDSIKIIKYPWDVYSVDLKFVRSDASEVDNDTILAKGNTGALTAGASRTAKIYMYDRYNNLVVPTQDSLLSDSIHAGNLQDTDLVIDTIGVSGYGQLGYFGTTAYPSFSVYPSSYELLASNGYVYLTFTTLGGDSGYGKAYTKLDNDYHSHDIIGTVADTLLYRTWLPNELGYYTVTVVNDSTAVVGNYITLIVEPYDSDSNPIYSFKYNYLRMTLLDSDGNAVEDQNMSSPAGVTSGDTAFVHWAKVANNPTNFADSTGAIGWSRAYPGAANADTTFSLSSDSFKVAVSKVISGADLKIESKSYNTSTNKEVTHSSTKDLNLCWRADAPDTVALSGTFTADTKGDLSVSIQDNYRNVISDSTYVVNFNASQPNIEAFNTDLVISGNGTVEIVPYAAGALTVRAKVLKNSVTDVDISGVYGFKTFTVASASINAPTSFGAADTPNDEGGYVTLSFTASSNHPGMSGTTDDNLAIDYYQVYRSTSNDLTTAVYWAVIPATPITSSTGTTIRAVVSTRGDKSTNAYYWVSAVKGELPPGFTSSDDAVASKAKELGYLYGYEIEAKAADVSTEYAIETDDNRLVSSADGPNRAIGAANTSLTADFNSDGTVGLTDLSLFAWAYGNTSEYDLLFDLDASSAVGLTDLSLFASQYGNSLSSASPVAVNNGVNIDAKTNVVSNNTNGDEFTVEVNLEGINKMSGYQFSIAYDSKIYEFVSVEHSDYLNTNGGESPIQVEKVEEGKVTIANVITDGEKSVNGEGSIATLTFKWIGDEVTEMTVEGIAVMDNNGKTNILENVVLEKPIKLPNDYALEHNYPNPFNPETTIKYALPKSSKVKMVIYNILGQKVRTLIDRDVKAGWHKVIWDGRNDHGVRVASGLYIYRIKAGNFTAQHKMVLLK